ncbi:hypothetical protein [Streptomyces sp. NPDC006638]|uniref:hypothetical protein n=1 Tax=Streptomyces sp. NPDC006638 TaxID=3157183 RepID=UPI0033A81B73
MTCRPCADRPHRVVRQFSGGNPRASLDAARAEDQERDQGADVHVHYALDRDQFEVALADR